MDAKFYASTQVIDEARHVEAYARLLHDKFELVYPINPFLKQLLDDTLSDSRWDFTYLGMQVLIEGVALAAFGTIRDQATNPLSQSVTAYVMQDEARHVAFGRLALRDYYPELTAKERDEREEFVVEGCYLLRDRFLAAEVWETLGLPVEECERHTDGSELMRVYRTLLFTRIVPTIKDIGLWGPRVQKAYADMGIIGFADGDLDAFAARDETIALEPPPPEIAPRPGGPPASASASRAAASRSIAGTRARRRSAPNSRSRRTCAATSRSAFSPTASGSSRTCSCRRGR